MRRPPTSHIKNRFLILQYYFMNVWILLSWSQQHQHGKVVTAKVLYNFFHTFFRAWRFSLYELINNFNTTDFNLITARDHCSGIMTYFYKHNLVEIFLFFVKTPLCTCNCTKKNNFNNGIIKKWRTNTVIKIRFVMSSLKYLIFILRTIFSYTMII